MTDLAPKLDPLVASHQADEVEAQIKAMTAEVFALNARSSEREVNLAGTPHLGAFAQVERWIKADGLALVRSNSEDAARYLYKAWRGQNPKRGLHFLRTYLQLLWPGGWDVDQMWQRKNQLYPTALYTNRDLAILGVTNPEQDYFLTSRINVDVSADTEAGLGLFQVARSIRYVCGAKYLLALRTLRRSHVSIFVASIGTPMQFLDTSGALQPTPGQSGSTGARTAGIGTPSVFVDSSGTVNF